MVVESTSSKSLAQKSPIRADFFELTQNITEIQSKNKLKSDNIAQSVKWGHLIQCGDADYVQEP